MSTTLFMRCHICYKEIVSLAVEEDTILPPWKVITWHKRAISHVTKEHLWKKAKTR
jgi:hypothetical protein